MSISFEYSAVINFAYQKWASTSRVNVFSEKRQLRKQTKKATWDLKNLCHYHTASCHSPSLF